MRRYEVSAEQFAGLADLFPANGRRGGQWRDHRTLLNAVLWVLHTGAQWRELPERYGPWQTAHRRLTVWRRNGTLTRILERLHLRLDAAGLIDHDLWCVDATAVRAGRSAAGGKTAPPGEPADHALGRSRGGYGTKLHLVVCGNGVPLAVLATAGQVHDSRLLEAALGAVRVRRAGPGRPRSRPKAVAGDKGYSHPRIRRYLRGRGVRAVIPRRKDQRPGDGRVRFDPAEYRRRNVVERCVGWLKGNRRLGTRHEKLAVNFPALAQLAAIRLCLRKLHP